MLQVLNMPNLIVFLVGTVMLCKKRKTNTCFMNRYTYIPCFPDSKSIKHDLLQALMFSIRGNMIRLGILSKLFDPITQIMKFLSQTQYAFNPVYHTACSIVHMSTLEVRYSIVNCIIHEAFDSFLSHTCPVHRDIDTPLHED